MSLADPAALKDSVLAAVDAGIPVITINSGSDVYKEFGAITHVGQDEFIAGQGAGTKFDEAGGTNLLCVMQEQANVGLEARCDGAEDTFGGAITRITTSGDADPTTSQQEIAAALDADDSIDAIFATGPVGAVLARNAVSDAGREVTIGSVDLSTDLLDAIEAGEIAFTIDQQQYLQGYLPVVLLYLNITNANTTGGGLPVYTGPGFVDARQRRRGQGPRGSRHPLSITRDRSPPRLIAVAIGGSGRDRSTFPGPSSCSVQSSHDCRSRGDHE